MPGSKVPVIRRRILRDAAFRERLHHDFEGTLEAEGLRAGLTDEQVGELQLGLYLLDVFKEQEATGTRPKVTPLFGPGGGRSRGAPAKSAPREHAPAPIDFAAWCARRRTGGH